jgi:TRAP-type C4-dicarboxylate transport system substrate-binding protein
MPTTHTNGTKSRPKANPYDHTHPLNKAAWKRLYDEMRAMVDVIEAESRHYEDKAANALASGIDDPSLEQQAKVTSALLDAAASLEDALYRVMYPELEQQDQQKGQYE